MPAARGKGGSSTRAKAGRRKRGAGGGGARATAGGQSLEHRILLTATMCLLAFGAVMVYSASSATTLLQGGGFGGSYLVKFVLYGGVGLIAMRVLARDGVAKVHSITAPLLAASFVLVLVLAEIGPSKRVPPVRFLATASYPLFEAQSVCPFGPI